MMKMVNKMGTNYYMVKGKEKVYIGKHIIPEEIPDYYDKFREIMEKYVDVDDFEYCEVIESSFIKLSLEDMYLLYDRVKKFDDVIELLNQPFLLAFFLTSDYDPLDGMWECMVG